MLFYKNKKRPWGLRPQTPTRFLKKARQKLYHKDQKWRDAPFLN